SPPPRPPTPTLFPYTTLFRSAAMQDTSGGVEAFEKSHAHPYPVGPIVAGSYQSYGVVGPPATVFINAQGVVVASFSGPLDTKTRSEEHTSELQSRENLVCRLL